MDAIVQRLNFRHNLTENLGLKLEKSWSSSSEYSKLEAMKTSATKTAEDL